MIWHKSVFWTPLLVGLAAPIEAQTHVAVSVGVTTTSRELRGDNVILRSNRDRRALGAGVSIRKNIARWFEISSGIAWTPKGFNRTEPTIHMWYAEIPLIVSVVLAHDHFPVGLVVGGGATIGRLVFCRRFVTGGAGFEDRCRAEEQDGGRIKPRFDVARWDVTKELRGRLFVRLGTKRLFIQGRLSASVGDIQPDYGGRTINHLSAFELGYEFTY